MFELDQAFVRRTLRAPATPARSLPTIAHHGAAIDELEAPHLPAERDIGEVTTTRAPADALREADRHRLAPDPLDPVTHRAAADTVASSV